LRFGGLKTRSTARAVDEGGSLAYVPGIHVFAKPKDVDGRDKPGHDAEFVGK
jgi:hypothetical protein